MLEVVVEEACFVLNSLTAVHAHIDERSGLGVMLQSCANLLHVYGFSCSCLERVLTCPCLLGFCRSDACRHFSSKCSCKSDSQCIYLFECNAFRLSMFVACILCMKMTFILKDHAWSLQIVEPPCSAAWGRERAMLERKATMGLQSRTFSYL